jgi:hypothetical protein
MKTKADTKALKVKRYLRAREAGKAGYEQADQLLEELVQTLKPGETVQLGNQEAAQLIDKFAAKNRIGAGLGVNRYEIKVSRVSDLKL